MQFKFVMKISHLQHENISHCIGTPSDADGKD